METNGKFEVAEQDVEYQSLAGKPWLVRIYQPKGAGPFPTIVDVHGGAWHNGDRNNNGGIDRALAANGILVAAVDFRQPPEAGYPASICDVNLAVRWLKAHAAEFNGTSAVGAFGNSSGGHQVALCGLRPRHANYSSLPLPNHPEIDAVLAYVIAAWPVIDPLFRFRYAKEINNQEHIKAHIEYWRTEEAMAEGNPQTILDRNEQSNLPPLLLLLKANDRNHPLEMQERFIASYRKRGGSIEAHTFDGLPEHRMVPAPSRPETMRFIEIVTAFIRRQTEIQGGRLMEKTKSDPIIIEQAGMRMTVAHRQGLGGSDEGLTFDITTTGSEHAGKRILRFDCFYKIPHYHVGASGGENAAHKMKEEGIEDPVHWTLEQLKTRFPAMIKQAGYEEIAEKIDQQSITDQLIRLEPEILARY